MAKKPVKLLTRSFGLLYNKWSIVLYLKVQNLMQAYTYMIRKIILYSLIIMNY